MTVIASVLCLAMNIYGEARGESLEGQMAVAQVTLNRVEHPAYPDDVCSVVFQESQFSWTRSPLEINEPEAFATSLQVAGQVLFDRPEDLTHGSTHFYSGKRVPSWAHRLDRVGRIDNHTFFRLPRS
jgi:spore germination cell wall hydrolase CwlJ-like protein